jgi:hypothetical protein
VADEGRVAKRDIHMSSLHRGCYKVG